MDMAIDHIIPVARGGETSLSNLCFSCVGCNAHKLAFVTAIDPETKSEVALYNPRRQQWSDHFSWDDESTRLIGLTGVGRATVLRLGINRCSAVKARQLWVQANLHPPE